MQKWLPDAFDAQDAAVAVAGVDRDVFQAERGADPDPSPQVKFRSEAGFADSQSLLGHLTQRERAQLFDLVEQDVAAEYEAREQEMQTGMQARLDALEEGFRQSLDNLSRELEKALTDRLQDVAAASARLAVQLAEKIVRDTVAVDSEVLARALEVTHYKLAEASRLAVSVHPDDAAWLEEQAELRERLKIARVHADRRVERGGCIIRTESEEWDATISRQLESLTEIVEEAIATAAGSAGLRPEKEPHEPEVG